MRCWHKGLEGDRPLHNFLKRRRRKERKLAAGVPLRPNGRPPKGYKIPEVEKDYEIKRLKMENELLRIFCGSLEGGESICEV